MVEKKNIYIYIYKETYLLMLAHETDKFAQCSEGHSSVSVVKISSLR